MNVLAAIMLMAAAPAAEVPETIGVRQAVATAEAALGARAVDAELERSPAGTVYEIELVRGSVLHEARVDAHSGKFLGSVQPRLKTAWRRWFDSQWLALAGNGPPLAKLLANVEQQTSGKVREVELEIEGARAWYDVEVATAAGVAQLHIDAASGRRLAARYDD